MSSEAATRRQRHRGRPSHRSARSPFVTESERAFARLLDYYQVTWQYEPHSFDLEWDANGVVTERFSPDFYLPELDLYVELTTLKQSLVTRKNRKLRRMRELYPDVRVKLLYNRDVHHLFAKYDMRVSS